MKERLKTAAIITAVTLAVLFAIPAVVAYGFVVHWLLVWIGLPPAGADTLVIFNYIILFAIFLTAVF